MLNTRGICKQLACRLHQQVAASNTSSEDDSSILSRFLTMSFVVHGAFLNSPSQAIAYVLSQTLTVLILYTVYLVLFSFSLYTIIHRKSSGRRFMLMTSSGMFLLATSGLIISIISMTIDIAFLKVIILSETVDTDSLFRANDILRIAYYIRLATNNLLTDLLFLYRCYVIWGSRRTVIIIPGISIVATCLLAYFTLGFDHSLLLSGQGPILDLRAPYVVGGATNVLLMCLTAGRIWYKSREARSLYGKAVRRHYNTVISMILESGALYCLMILLEIFSLSLSSDSEAVAVFQGVCDGLVEQMINIIPTLIFVRVGMGYCQWNQHSSPLEVRPPVPTPKLQEEAFPSDTGSEVTEFK
ncbi:hypothetical protein MSAN_00419500 [Mycena sanguinolenta]|uniref:Uncharacterized protein n=1 Tax=Mycena sanguinolenta TaxID=230812 RepID=A0A8H7DL83_9AGAR|nr:hypothetical protein MSAN_00419500 [Mycena sanguinolenta]